jgi:probable HAF family extracellular repeat protein
VEASALNDDARIAGAVSDAADQNAVAAVWGPSGDGQMLGTIGADTGSAALGVNSRGVVVGGSGAVNYSAAAAYAHAFVWTGNGPIRDLNALIPAGSPLTLNVAYAVNDEGAIAGLGTNASGETHAFVLVPDGCAGADYEPASRAPVAPGSIVRMARPAIGGAGRWGGRFTPAP